MSLKKLTILLVVVFSALVAGCSKDPEVAKKEYLERGSRYAEQKKYPEAIIEYRNAIQQDPQYGEARLKLAEAYIQTQDFRNALFEYVRASDLLPNHNEAQLKAGSLLLLAQRFDDAKARAQRILSNDPKNVDAHILNVNALTGLNDLDGAIQQIDSAIQQDPNESRLYGVLGTLQAAHGKNQEARTAFEKSVALDPKSITARLALANYLWTARQLAEAEKNLQEAIALEPHHPQANRALAAFYMATGRTAEAEKPLETLAETEKAPAAQLELADYYVLTKREQEGRALLTKVLQEPKGFAEAQRRLAALDFANGQRESAHRLIDEVLAREPKNAEALLLKGRFLLADNQVDEAIAKVEAATTANPAFIAGHYLLGTIYASRQNIDQATIAFNRILQIDPNAVAAQMELAKLSLMTGDVKAASRYAEDAVKRQPDNPELQLLLVRTLAAQNELGKAEALLNDLAQKFPKMPTPYIQLAALHLQKSDLIATRRALERALERDSNSLEALAGLATVDLIEKKPETAITRIEKRLQAAPDDPNILLVAARTYAAAGDPGKAERTLRKVLEVAPEHLETFRLLAQLYIGQGKLDQARQEFEQLAARRPTDVGAHTMVGVIFQEQQKNTEARQWYEKALKANPRAVVAANNLAWLLAESGQDLSAALQYAKQAKEVQPEHPDVADTLGWIYYKQDNMPLAIREFRQSITKNAQNPLYHYHLGMAYLKTGDKERAKQSLQEALRLSPNFPDAADAKAQLGAL